MIHAIGDEANLRILDIYREIADKDGVRDRRFRIEHAQRLRPSEIPRFSSQKVIASMQPCHAADVFTVFLDQFGVIDIGNKPVLRTATLRILDALADAGWSIALKLRGTFLTPWHQRFVAP